MHVLTRKYLKHQMCRYSRIEMIFHLSSLNGSLGLSRLSLNNPVFIYHKRRKSERLMLRFKIKESVQLTRPTIGHLNSGSRLLIQFHILAIQAIILIVKDTQ
jgi:hypothetical protein